MRRRLIAIIGGHRHNTTLAAMALAEAMGELLARYGYGVVCGGGDGIMEAACRGNRVAGGLTVGILKFNDPDVANPFVDVAIATSMDVASNNLIIWSAEAVIAFEGCFGTLNEMALTLDFGKPLILLGPSGLLASKNITSNMFWHDLEPSVARLPEILDRMETMIEVAHTYVAKRKSGHG